MTSDDISNANECTVRPVRPMRGRRQAVAHFVRYSLAAALLPLAAFGAEARTPILTPTTLQEVTVTATRRAEPLSKVPISISAFTQKEMAERGFKNFVDVARFTPGVQMSFGSGNEATGAANTISIRGISSSGGASTTGIYIDDTPIQMRAMGFNADEALPSTFDVARVEVLRGPQGTLFGAGSEGGTVRYIMTQPSVTQSSGHTTAEISYTQGGTESYDAGAAFGSPIVGDKLGFRVSAWYRKDGGYVDRIDPVTLALVDPNANSQETAFLRGALLWEPTDDVQVTQGVLWQRRQQHDVSNYWPIYSDADQDKFVSATPEAQIHPDEYLLPSLKVVVRLGPANFVSDSSYYRRRDISGYDGTLSGLEYYQSLGWAGGETTALGTIPAVGSLPYAGSAPCSVQGFSCYPLVDGTGEHVPAALADYRVDGAITNNQDDITQEFRLESNDPDARIVWTVGAFYALNRTQSLEDIRDPMADRFFEYVYGTTIASVFGTPMNPDGSSYLPEGDAYLDHLTGFDRQLAGYGQAVWKLTRSLSLTTGLRYSKVDFNFRSYSDGPTNGGPAYASGVDHEKPITKRVGLAWQVNPRDMIYGTYSTGFRIGGANPNVPADICGVDFQNFGISAAPKSYQADTVKNYEVGTKDRIAGLAELSASAYYIDWNQIQQQIYLPDCGLTYTGNVGKAVSKGFDLQTAVAITDSLTLESAIGYNDSYFTAGAYPGTNHTGRPLIAEGDATQGENAAPGAPWTITLGLEYRFHVFSRRSYFRADYERHTKNNRLSAVEDPRTSQYSSCSTASGAVVACNYTPPATTLVSLRLGQEGDDWDISVFVNNLLNSNTVTNYSYSSADGFGPQIPGPYGGAPAATLLYQNTTFRPRTFGITADYEF